MRTRFLLGAGVLAVLSPFVQAQTLGGASGPAGDAQKVEKCDAPKGTLAVVEPQDAVLQSLQTMGLGSPTSMIRLIIQQSNCFQIVERGAAFQNVMQERALAAGGQLQAGANVGQGQLVAADFVVTPSVVFSNNNAGGVGGGIGGLLGGFGGGGGRVLGAIAGGLKFKEAQTSMTMADTRSGIQVAAAEGSAQKTDFNIGGALIGGGAGAALGGYTNTAEGKIVAASFLDNWNKIVLNIRNNPSLIQAKAGPASQANAAHSVKAGAAVAGDVYLAKIAGVKVYRDANESAGLAMTLSKTDEVIAEGQEQDGFMKVATPKGSGWVKAIMMRKQ
ncbi:CsgG/HfaB family protein [Ramlibacter humi]|uniref:Peptidoglycan-binding protein n=1 Tax=Ramlibacter humi TaxID=2530451 RepID=A0A4Z0BU00_9BURK|nr:CsgG/HfaB family protein [Ramlibacter humi]TFZ01880.1 peptidoglycan-binding protein [Ramlibacter humi]